MKRKPLILLPALLLGTALAACENNGEGSEPPLPSPPTAEGQETAPATLGACGDLSGFATNDVVSIGVCDDNDAGTQTVLGFANYDCEDGRKLYWADLGWGLEGDAWHDHSRSDGQLIPPQEHIDSCLGE